MPEPYQPNPELHDDYRCFVLDSGINGNQALYLTDYLVVPGNDQLVHHVVAYQVTSEEARMEAIQNDQDEAGPGYSCFGGAGVQGVRMVMNWAPGTASVSHPKGTGIRLDPELPLVFQVHYHIMGGNTGYDQTSIKMKMAEKVANEITPTFLTPLKPLVIPPKQERWVHEGQASLQHVYGENQPLKIMGVRAHMHKLGSEMHLSVKTKQAEECLADIPKYDFNWQTSYFLENPVRISSSDPISIRCVYNSMSKNTSTYWGEGTDDEMCLATIYTIKE
ncbi:MAG: hypothetical protein ACOH5I_17485 [Oligoflexus sp.]